MSNCVNIHNTMAVALSEIDSDKLFHDIDLYNATDNSTFNSDKPDAYGVWWFLGRDNVRVENDHLHIDLGDHRSQHTWRDLRFTLEIIASYMHDKGKGKTIRLILSDEADSFTTEGYADFELDNLWDRAA